MIIKNVRVYTEDQQFTDGEIVIRDGMIGDSHVVSGVDAEPEAGEEVLDGEGCYAIPGLIDLHFTDVWGMISVMERKKQSKRLPDMRHPLV